MIYTITDQTPCQDVPVEQLQLGDEIVFPWREEPYPCKLRITTDSLTIRGESGPQGQTPVLDGAGAVSRVTAGHHQVLEAYGIIRIGEPAYQGHRPQNVTIENLKIQHTGRGAFVEHGVPRAYDDGGSACIRLDAGDYINIRRVEFTGCDFGFFAKAGHHFLAIEDSWFHGNNPTNRGGVHHAYTQGFNTFIRNNQYDDISQIAHKSRDAGFWFIGNQVGNAAIQLDMVDYEDNCPEAHGWPQQGQDIVEGNLFNNTNIVAGATHGASVHYGGDHHDNQACYRRGQLVFRDNQLVRHYAPKPDGNPWYADNWLRVSSNAESVHFGGNTLTTTGHPIGFMRLLGTQEFTECGIEDCGGTWYIEPGNVASPAGVTDRNPDRRAPSLGVDGEVGEVFGWELITGAVPSANPPPPPEENSLRQQCESAALSGWL